MAKAADHLKYYMKPGQVPSEAALRCAELLDQWTGLHHISEEYKRKANWTDDRYVEIKLQTGLATFDFNELTALVLLAHDHCVRVDIVSAARGVVTLMLHPRTRNGSMSQRHPTIEAALEQHRSRNPFEKVLSPVRPEVPA